jgi:hypothetical protein
MENFDARWQAVMEMLEGRFGKQPDMEAILFLIGMNEYGQLPHRYKFTKEQKQDLMHVAVCTLLAQVGVFRLAGHDEEGWPHFEAVTAVPAAGLAQEEQLLKECVVQYFGL